MSLLMKKGAEEAYKHCNNTYGALNDIRLLLASSPAKQHIPETVMEHLLVPLKYAEKECKKSYDWICALKE